MNHAYKTRNLTAVILFFAILSIPLWLSLTATRTIAGVNSEVIVGTAVDYQLSPPANTITQSAAIQQNGREINPRQIPLLAQSDSIEERGDAPIDPLIATSYNTTAMTPPLDFSFPGMYGQIACGGCTPPDTNGAAGMNHYVQMVNRGVVTVYDKVGTSPFPYALGSLWTTGSICANSTGDPIVLYDQMAQRWLLSQFANPNHMCVAISTMDDPLGTFHLYTFNVGSFPDYFKFGIWPDGYYMSANEPSYYTAYAFEREKMLNGDPSATFQKINTSLNNLLLPSDMDGLAPPPPDSPNYFYTFKDSTAHSSSTDRLEIYEFHTDWMMPPNTTFTLADSINLTPFTYTACGAWNFNCIKQQGTTQRLDSIGEWPMFRFPYRHFDGYETLLGTFGVGGGLGEVGAAIRWFELRKSGGNWSLHQEGTHDPNDGHDRSMSSIGMDGMGNIALGYSVSSSGMYPGIHYATRSVGDPSGTMQAEAILISGGGSQTGSNRWGDYTSMSIDPANDCSFWYTNEYYTANSPSYWDTHVGVFTIPDCLPIVMATPVLTSTQLLNVHITRTLTISNSGGTPLHWSIDEDGSGGAACSMSQDIPWIANVTPNLGALLAGEQTAVNVQFDSTAVGVGTHTANLCVHSSDTMNPVMPIAVTMTVVPTFFVYLPVVIK